MADDKYTYHDHGALSQFGTQHLLIHNNYSQRTMSRMDPHANSPSIKASHSICYFQKLPQELVLEILKWVRSADLVPLIVSAKFFHNTWNEYYTAICRSLLRREATFATREALELLKTETGIPGMQCLDPTTLQLTDQKTGYASRPQAAKLLQNCIKAQTELSQFNRDIRKAHKKPDMTDIECSRFLRNLYRLWTYRLTEDKNYLSSFGILELRRIEEISDWCLLQSCSPVDGEIFFNISKARENIESSNGILGGAVAAPWTPKGYFSLFDEWWKYWERMSSSTGEPCNVVKLDAVVRGRYSHRHASRCGECSRLLESGEYEIEYDPEDVVCGKVYDPELHEPDRIFGPMASLSSLDEFLARLQMGQYRGYF